MQTILITGFDRFPGAPVNPSGVVATLLGRRRRPALTATRRVSHVFATSYDAVDRELPALLARVKPDILVMFGVATRSRGVRVEERARNRVALYPDAARYRPPAQTIALRRDARRNPLPLDRLVNAARVTGVATVRSRNAGSYLCNYAYWRGLEAAEQPDGPDVVVFVHVPPVAAKETPRRPVDKRAVKKTLPGRPLKKRPGTPPGRAAKPVAKQRRASIGDLVRAGEAIVLATTSLAKAPLPTMSPATTQSPPAVSPQPEPDQRLPPAAVASAGQEAAGGSSRADRPSVPPQPGSDRDLPPAAVASTGQEAAASRSHADSRAPGPPPSMLQSIWNRLRSLAGS
jgi:pyroglutamyl-peptidase